MRGNKASQALRKSVRDALIEVGAFVCLTDYPPGLVVLTGCRLCKPTGPAS